MMKYRAYDLVLCVLLLVPIGVLIGLVALLVVLVDQNMSVGKRPIDGAILFVMGFLLCLMFRDEET